MSEIDYTAVLADLERKRAELDAAINGIRFMIGAGADTPEPAVYPQGTTNLVDPIQPPKSHAFFNMAIAEAAKKFLGMAKEPKRAKDIADALKQGGLINTSPNFPATVATTLRREAKAGSVVQLPDKSWGLSAWFPGGSKARVKANGQASSGPEGLDSSETPEGSEDSRASASSSES